MRRFWAALAALVTVAIASILLLDPREPAAPPPTNSPDPAAHWGEYLALLDGGALTDTLVADRWRKASEDALRHAVVVGTPYREAVSITAGEEWAIGLRARLLRGQEFVLSVDRRGRGVGELLFVDLFEMSSRYGGFATGLVSERTHTTGRGEAFRFTAPRDGEYVLRLQAQPLRSVSFTLRAEKGPAYLFPVEGATPRDIWSVFGDSRGGGRRIHHGIDIFAPRGTILRAATDAYVARVGTRSLGGKIVTLYDQKRDIYLYYAHLDDWIAEEGSFVRAGDPIGTVGNTGNARSTPPHLHIGLYNGWWSRPIDPWNFFVSDESAGGPERELLLAALGDRRQLGAGVEARIFVDGVPRTETLGEERLVSVIGVSDETARVVLDEGIPALVSPEHLR